MSNETKPPVKRYRVGPGGIVEHLEEAPPILESEIQEELKKGGPQRHISGRKINPNSSNSPLIPSSDSDEQVSLTEISQKKNSKPRNSKFDSDLVKSWVIVICIGIIIFVFFTKWLGDGSSGTTVDEILPESTQLFDHKDGSNLLHMIKTLLSMIWILMSAIINILWAILETLLGL